MPNRPGLNPVPALTDWETELMQASVSISGNWENNIFLSKVNREHSTKGKMFRTAW
jgi:hypothetical protein